MAASTLADLLAPNFKSINAAETKDKATLIKQVQFFWKLIPDLTWKIEEMLQDGDRVVVAARPPGRRRGISWVCRSMARVPSGS